MTQPHACNDAEFLASVDGIDALPQLLRLLSRGEPVDLDQLIALAGPAGAALAGVVRAQPGTEWDGDGQLVGFGLTPRPTDFSFHLGGKTLYTWCASDTLFFSVMLGEHTVVESICPTTGTPIRLGITPATITSVTPTEAVISQRHRRDLVENLRTDICDHGRFFASRAAAADWLAAHPDGQVLSIADAFAECLAACEELGWLSPEMTSP